MGLFFALILSGFILYFPNSGSVVSNPLFKVGIIIFSIFAYFFHYFTNVYAWNNIQNVERATNAEILDVFTKKSLKKPITWFLTFFLFFTLFVSLYADQLPFRSNSWLLSLWIIFTGLILDSFQIYLKQIYKYSSIHEVINSQVNRLNLANDSSIDQDCRNVIDTVTSIAMKGLYVNNFLIVQEALEQFTLISKKYLPFAFKNKEKYHSSETGYTIYYLLDRLELLNNLAIQKNLSTICSSIISTTGKIILECSKTVFSSTPLAINTLGKITLKGQSHNIPDIGLKGSLTLLEIAKILIFDHDLHNKEIKETFIALSNNLEEITKEIFKKNKSIDFTVLMSPLQELKILLSHDNLQKHQDIIAILQNLDRIFAEFTSLELVMKTIPPIPKLNT